MDPTPIGKVGVLMLDTRFPRPVGDIGHPHTWLPLGLQPMYQVVCGALPQAVVQRGDETDWQQPFEQAAQALIEQGADLITTSCGFLARYQRAWQQALSVPVCTSSLLWCAQLESPGILTIDAQRLGPQDLQGAGVPMGTPIVGVDPQGEFHRRILGNEAEMDLSQAQDDVVRAACALVDRHPQVQHIVLECTNMSPYAAAIQAATGRPTHDVVQWVLRTWTERSSNSPNASG